ERHLAALHRHRYIAHLEPAAAQPFAQIILYIFVRTHIALGINRAARLRLVGKSQTRAAGKMALAHALALPLRVVLPAVWLGIDVARRVARVFPGHGVVIAAVVGVAFAGIGIAPGGISGIGTAVVIAPLGFGVRQVVQAIAHRGPPSQ